MAKTNKCVATSEDAGVVGYSCCTDGEDYASCTFNEPNKTGMCEHHGYQGACLSWLAQQDFDEAEEAEEALVRR